MINAQPSHSQDYLDPDDAVVTAQVYSTPVYEQLRDFPLPLTIGKRHDVLLLCHKNFEQLRWDIRPDHLRRDHEGEMTMWKYLELLVTTNGNIHLCNITTMLYELYHMDQAKCNMPFSSINHNQSGEMINMFQHLCGTGQEKAALNFAVVNRMWGHAFHLAFLMGGEFTAIVANSFMHESVEMESPIQSLHQLKLGKIPLYVSNESHGNNMGDWRHHLATILSQKADQPIIVNQTLKTMAQVFTEKGYHYRAHFCLLMCNHPFEAVDEPSAKLVLIGLENADECKFGSKYVINAALQMTMIYEFGHRLLDPSFCLPTLAEFKMAYIKHLRNHQLTKLACEFCHQLCLEVQQQPNYFTTDIICALSKLAERFLKFGYTTGLICNPEHWIAEIGDIAIRKQAGEFPYTRFTPPNELKVGRSHCYHQLACDMIYPQFQEHEQPTQQSMVIQVPGTLTVSQGSASASGEAGSKFYGISKSATDSAEAQFISKLPSISVPQGMAAVEGHGQVPSPLAVNEDSASMQVVHQLPDISQLPSGNTPMKPFKMQNQPFKNLLQQQNILSPEPKFDFLVAFKMWFDKFKDLGISYNKLYSWITQLFKEGHIDKLGNWTKTTPLDILCKTYMEHVETDNQKHCPEPEDAFHGEIAAQSICQASATHFKNFSHNQLQKPDYDCIYQKWQKYSQYVGMDFEQLYHWTSEKMRQGYMDEFGNNIAPTIPLVYHCPNPKTSVSPHVKPSHDLVYEKWHKYSKHFGMNFMQLYQWMSDEMAKGHMDGFGNKVEAVHPWGNSIGTSSAGTCHRLKGISVEHQVDTSIQDVNHHIGIWSPHKDTITVKSIIPPTEISKVSGNIVIQNNTQEKLADNSEQDNEPLEDKHSSLEGNIISVTLSF